MVESRGTRNFEPFDRKLIFFAPQIFITLLKGSLGPPVSARRVIISLFRIKDETKRVQQEDVKIIRD